jgi:hypothetical protein
MCSLFANLRSWVRRFWPDSPSPQMRILPVPVRRGRSPTARAVPNRKAAVSRLSQSSVRRDRGGDRLFARSRQRIPEIAGEQVAAPTDRPDQVTVRPDQVMVRPKDVAQYRNLSLKGVFLNVAVGPDAACQRVLPDDSPAGLDQRQEDIKGTPADPDRLAVDQKLAAMRQIRKRPNSTIAGVSDIGSISTTIAVVSGYYRIFQSRRR